MADSVFADRRAELVQRWRERDYVDVEPAEVLHRLIGDINECEHDIHGDPTTCYRDVMTAVQEDLIKRGWTPPSDLIDAHGTLAAHLADDSHTNEEHHYQPGVYLSKGHALLVGTNQRNLTVVDLGGVIQVAGIDVTDPDHLDAFAEYFQRLAAAFRTRHPVPEGADQ